MIYNLCIGVERGQQRESIKEGVDIRVLFFKEIFILELLWVI